MYPRVNINFDEFVIIVISIHIITYRYNEQEGLQLLNNEGCICFSESLTYKCTVFGERGGSTVWQGSAFNCTSREINLFHSDYEATEGAHRDRVW